MTLMAQFLIQPLHTPPPLHSPPAGGSAKQARDRRFQAILPLRGKILNVERADDASLYKNRELADLIVALGLGPKGSDSGLSGLRYSKVVLLTDADVDGAHIRTLLLTFLFRWGMWPGFGVGLLVAAGAGAGAGSTAPGCRPIGPEARQARSAAHELVRMAETAGGRWHQAQACV